LDARALFGSELIRMIYPMADIEKLKKGGLERG
jgi:hypothetical protein